MKFISTLALFSATSLAANASWLDGERLTGDWQGARTAQESAGYKTFAYYSGIFAANVDGGIRDDSGYSGDLFVGMEFDLEKIYGWEDSTFVISGIDRHGNSIDPAVGGQYSVMQNVGGQNAFLYNVTFEKLFLDQALSVKFGRMTATDDFVGSPYYGYSVNNAVNGQIRAALFDGVMTSYPFAVWGGRVKYKLSEEVQLMAGIFQISEDMFDRDGQGVDLKIDGDDGVSIFTQIDWNPKFDDRPAHFFAGMNNVFYDMEQYDSNGTREEFTRFYAHADYQVYAESPGSEEGLVLLMTLAYTPFEDAAILPLQTTWAANYTGLFPGRPADKTVFFATYGDFSGELGDERIAAGQAAPDYEMVLELAHRFQLTPSSYIQPDIQYIVKPGGTGNVDNALVLGFQFGTSF